MGTRERRGSSGKRSGGPREVVGKYRERRGFFVGFTGAASSRGTSVASVAIRTDAPPSPFRPPPMKSRESGYPSPKLPQSWHPVCSSSCRDRRRRAGGNRLGGGPAIHQRARTSSNVAPLPRFPASSTGRFLHPTHPQCHRIPRSPPDRCGLFPRPPSPSRAAPQPLRQVLRRRSRRPRICAIWPPCQAWCSTRR